MDEDSWNKMKHLYLEIQIGLHDASDYGDAEDDWVKLKKSFFQLTMKNNSSSGTHAVDFRANQMIKELEAYITFHSLDQMNFELETSCLKLIHSIICSVIECWSEVSPHSLDLEEVLTDTGILALDKGIKMVSDALMVVYHNYGELTQALACQNLLKEKPFEEQEPLIYLSKATNKKELFDYNMGNNDHIDSQGKRKRIDSLKSEKKSNMNEYEINLPQKIRLLQSWEQGSVPNQDTNFSNENNLGNILSHLENRILKHPHSSEGRDQHSIPAQFLRQAQIIKNYSDFTRTENSDVVKKMFHFKRLLENSLLSVYTKYY